MSSGSGWSLTHTSEGYRLTLSTAAIVAGLLGLYLVAIGLRALRTDIALDLAATVEPETIRGLTVDLPLIVGTVVDPPLLLVAPVVVLALTFVPGGLALLWASDEFGFDARSVVYAVGLSLMALMGVGFVLNLTLPLVGITTPQTPGPLAGGVTLLVVILAGAVVWGDDRPDRSVVLPDLTTPIPVALLLLPLLSVLSIVVWNLSITNRPLLAVLTAAALVPLVLVTVVDDRWHALGVWCLALTVLYHATLWKHNGFSGNPAGIWTWREGIWTPGTLQIQETSSELLQNGVLFPLYAHLTDLHILTQYTVVNPFFVSFLPVALYVAVRRYTASQVAVLSAALFIVAHPFYIQYPQAGRSATPVLFLALLGVVISDAGSIRQALASALGLIFATGVAVSHYGTAYFVMVALLGAFALVVVLAAVDQYLVGPDRASGALQTDGGGVLAAVDPRQLTGSRLLSKPFVAWYSTLALAWYLFIAGGRKFSVLPNHAYRSLRQLLAGSMFSGRSAARVQRDYGSSVIDLSRQLYILIALLTVVGLAYGYYRRFVADDTAFVDDTYLALATMLLGLFGVTFIVRNWGGGRPMMIAFTFVALFSVVGTIVLTALLRYPFARREAGSLRQYLDSIEFTGGAGVSLFAMLVAVMLILNSGVASAALVGGEAPSNVPLQEDSDRVTDIATHVWMVEHHGGPSVYGDPTARAHTDWYRPEIVASTEPTADYGPWRPRGDLTEVLRRNGDLSADPEYGYLLLLGQNLDQGVFWTGYTDEGVSTDQVRPPLADHNRIYTTGESEIYHWPTTNSSE